MLLPHIEGDAVLIRHKQPNAVNGHLKLRPRHVIFVGNGAISGGTSPLVQAIADTTGKRTPDHVAASVASILGQQFRSRKYFALKDLAEILANVPSLDDYLADYYSFKSALSKHYAEAFANGRLALRTTRALEQLLATVPAADIGVITVNWDQCIWEETRFENVIQLHGVASASESIVLPGEYADDDAITDVLEGMGFTIQDEEVRTQVLRMFRGDYRRPLTAALQTAGFWLAEAETILAWGLAFHAYDAEVCHLAWDVGQNPRRSKTITVVNPSEADRAMCRFLFSAPEHQFVEVST